MRIFNTNNHMSHKQCLIFCADHVQFPFKSYQKHLAQGRGNIGIWTNVNELLGYEGLSARAAILIRLKTQRSQKPTPKHLEWERLSLLDDTFE